MKMLLILAALAGPAGTDPFTDAVLLLSGASCMEELDGDEIERYRHYHEHPLDINNASPGRLEASGLFSRFQLVSLARYRKEYGDILSFTELSLVSGFDAESAGALRCFVLLSSRRPPGSREKEHIEGELMVRGASRKEYEADGQSDESSFGVKAYAGFGERGEIRLASRTSYNNPSFRLGTVSAAWYGRNVPFKVVAGNFAARFGQGLTQWSGFSLSSLNKVSAFRRNGSGLSATSSFSPDLLGLGGDIAAGPFVISAACSFNGGARPLGNICWTSDRMSAGITASSEKIGADIRAGFKDVGLFAEFSTLWSGGAAALAGAVWTPSYGNRLAFQARCFDPRFKKDYSGLAVCFENHWLDVSVDAAWHFVNRMAQYKAFAEISPSLEYGSLVLHPALRCSTRCRVEYPVPGASGVLSGDSWRTDLRGEIGAEMGRWLVNARYNLLWCRSRAWLWYVEPGYRTDEAGAYLRFTLFKVDSWDDRIYVYERDAPGSFNVPAYYGRGYSISAVASLKFGDRRFRHRADIRGSFISYPWNAAPKPSRLELKVQYTLCFYCRGKNGVR